MNVEEILKYIFAVASGISTVIGVVLTIRTLALEIYKSNVIPRRAFLPIENISGDSRSAIVLKDLETIMQFQKRGLPYLKEEPREMLFWLHSQLKGKMTYKEITLVNNLVYLDSENKILVLLPSEHILLKWFKNGAYIFLSLIHI